MIGIMPQYAAFNADILFFNLQYIFSFVFNNVHKMVDTHICFQNEMSDAKSSVCKIPFRKSKFLFYSQSFHLCFPYIDARLIINGKSVDDAIIQGWYRKKEHAVILWTVWPLQTRKNLSSAFPKSCKKFPCFKISFKV